ncbi:MAG TPA: DeoR family transcriptional regulator [Thermosulfurimonas dismutans]|uniref:DeoR family transcriptional regulator n=1 Tax=Thermosulfurimonas dismutans TaxID=999894 RepID=A0A7C3CJS8_9BACT|nr:DeoR family transcriptional regulator [Thermosulfurimonas dismutans]
MQSLGLNERQIKAVLYVKERGRITNREYQELTGISKRTATRDLDELLEKGVFERLGATGRGTQ